MHYTRFVILLIGVLLSACTVVEGTVKELRRTVNVDEEKPSPYGVGLYYDEMNDANMAYRNYLIAYRMGDVRALAKLNEIQPKLLPLSMQQERTGVYADTLEHLDKRYTVPPQFLDTAIRH